MPALPPSHAFTLKNQHPFHKLSIHSPVVRYRWSRIALVIYFFTLTVGVNGDKLGFTVCVCVCFAVPWCLINRLIDQLITDTDISSWSLSLPRPRYLRISGLYYHVTY